MSAYLPLIATITALMSGFICGVLWSGLVVKRIAHKVVDTIEERILEDEKQAREDASSFAEFEDGIEYN